MMGNLLRVSAVLVCVLLISPPVYADVVGTWDISGTAKEKITIKGEGSASERMQVIDHFIFREDRSFEMLELPDGSHTWDYVKQMTKFAVYLDDSVLETYWIDALEDLFSEYGITVDVGNFAITKNIFAGNHNTKKDTLKGKWTLMFETYLYVYDLGRGFDMKVTVTTTFTGNRSAGAGALMVEPTQPCELSDEGSNHSLMEEVCNQIRKAIMGCEPE